MTEHYIEWPDNRDSRRKLAKELGWTGAAAEKAYKEQSTERLGVANWRKDKGFPPGRPRKGVQDDTTPTGKSVVRALHAALVSTAPLHVPDGLAPLDFDAKLLAGVTTFQKEHLDFANKLPTTDFLGTCPPPVSIVVKDASGEPVGGGAVFVPPRVQVLIDGEPADFVTQWVADEPVRAVEDLEHEYTKRIELQAKVESLQEENALLRENLGLSQFLAELNDKLLAELNNKLLGAERAERGEAPTQTLKYVNALDDLGRARQGIQRLDNAVQLLKGSRDDWRAWTILSLVALLVAAGHWESLPLGLFGAVSAAFAVAFIVKEGLAEEDSIPLAGEVTYTSYVANPLKPACTDDICTCLPDPAPGCGHAPSTPFDVPGVLPETPQVVVGDNDKEG